MGHILTANWSCMGEVCLRHRVTNAKMSTALGYETFLEHLLCVQDCLRCPRLCESCNVLEMGYEAFLEHLRCVQDCLWCSRLSESCNVLEMGYETFLEHLLCVQDCLRCRAQQEAQM